jgi:hypothetical protein
MFDRSEPGSVPGSTTDVLTAGRCHVEDGRALSPGTAQMLTCGAVLSWMRHGRDVPPSPDLPPPDGTIQDSHDADITPDTIIPAWYGERLDLDYAIYTCFANARTPQERKEQRDQAADPELFRPTKWVIEPADWIRGIQERTAA